MSYPDAPWRMHGQLWLTLFRVRGVADRPDGVYGAAFVSYEAPSPLTYSELLVARPTDDRQVTISDIWVDSPDSVAGGRELWAIPKGLCDFTLESSHTGPLARTEWSASYARRPIAAARFTDVSRAAVRLPFKGATFQPGIEETAGQDRSATLTGSARSLPCRGRWDFAPDGPLAWLRDARQLASFRMSGFRMTFG